MKNAIHLFFFLLLALAGCKSCDREKAIPPVEKPLSAAFRFYDQVGGTDAPINEPGFRMIETDTFYQSKRGTYWPIRVIYQADDTSADNYSWKVGDDPRTFYNKASALQFSNPGTYPVTLKISRQGKDGKVTSDSLTKNFTIIRKEFHPIIGKYVGFNVSKPDSLFKVYIGHGSPGLWPWIIDTSKQFSGYSEIIFTGLQGKRYSSDGLAVSSKGAFNSETSALWPDLIGNFILRSLFIIPSPRFDSVVIEYHKCKMTAELSSEPCKFIPEKFIGKRYQ